MAENFMVPPFGALGFVYSKFLKSDPYFSSPNSEMPWLPLPAGSVAASEARAANGNKAAEPRNERRSMVPPDGGFTPLTTPKPPDARAHRPRPIRARPTPGRAAAPANRWQHRRRPRQSAASR